MSDRATPPSCRLQSDTPKLSASASIPDAVHRPSHVDAKGHNAPHSVFRGEAGNDPPLHHASGGTPPVAFPTDSVMACPGNSARSLPTNSSIQSSSCSPSSPPCKTKVPKPSRAPPGNNRVFAPETNGSARRNGWNGEARNNNSCCDTTKRFQRVRE